MTFWKLHIRVLQPAALVSTFFAVFCNSKDFQFSSQELKKKYGGDSGIENTTSSSKIQLNSRSVGGGFSCCGS